MSFKYLNSLKIQKNTGKYHILLNIIIINNLWIIRLVLKVYKANKDTGTIGTSWKPIKIVITVDNHLLLFDSEDDSKVSNLFGLNP